MMQDFTFSFEISFWYPQISLNYGAIAVGLMLHMDGGGGSKVGNWSTAVSCTSQRTLAAQRPLRATSALILNAKVMHFIAQLKHSGLRQSAYKIGGGEVCS